jgi:hypothetical protein
MGGWFRKAEPRRQVGYTVADLVRAQNAIALRKAAAERLAEQRRRNAAAMRRVAGAPA